MHIIILGIPKLDPILFYCCSNQTNYTLSLHELHWDLLFKKKDY